MEDVITLEDQGIELDVPHDAKVRETLRIPLRRERYSASGKLYVDLIGYYLLPSGIITTPRGEISTFAKRNYDGEVRWNNQAHKRRQLASMAKDFCYRDTDEESRSPSE